jgi:hypothetical protein
MLRTALFAGIARFSSAALLTAVCATAAPRALAQVTLSLSKPLYEAGEPAMISISGAPGDIPYMLVNGAGGSYMVPGLGEILVAVDSGLMVFQMPPLDAAGNASYQCLIDCGNPVLDGPCFLQVVTLDPTNTMFSGLSNLVVLQYAASNCGNCARAALPDPTWALLGGDSAIYLPGIVTHLDFIAGGEFVENGDGTARLLGIVAHPNNPLNAFAVDIGFSGRLNPAQPGYPPLGSPKEELAPAAYAQNGGPVNPGTWHYYEVTDGYLTGLDLNVGALVHVLRIGPAFQVGAGASGKNLEIGASGWIEAFTLSQPTGGHVFATYVANGDININHGGDCTDCADEAISDAAWSIFPNHKNALHLPGIWPDFRLEDGATYSELADGTARLLGVARHSQDALKRFAVDVTFDLRVAPGGGGYPPAGSPKLELLPAAYVENGGPVDTGTWHYYKATSGTLTGLDKYAGALVQIDRVGPSWQVGIGASGKNLDFGGSGWISVLILAQPDDAGEAFAVLQPDGDINITIGCP